MDDGAYMTRDELNSAIHYLSFIVLHRKYARRYLLHWYRHFNVHIVPPLQAIHAFQLDISQRQWPRTARFSEFVKRQPSQGTRTYSPSILRIWLHTRLVIMITFQNQCEIFQSNLSFVLSRTHVMRISSSFPIRMDALHKVHRYFTFSTSSLCLSSFVHELNFCHNL